MSFLRRSPLVLLAALVLAAGPVASAACAAVPDLHPAPATPVDPAPMAHGMGETPPCHEAPAEAPAPDDTPHGLPHDCGSACCASEAPALPPAPLAMPAVAAVAVAVQVAHPAERTAEADDLPPVPLRRARSLVVDLQRFLI